MDIRLSHGEASRGKIDANGECNWNVRSSCNTRALSPIGAVVLASVKIHPGEIRPTLSCEDGQTPDETNKGGA